MLHLGEPPTLQVHAATAFSDLVIRRVFPARVADVWQAWTDAGPFARWWGPDECRNTVREFDGRVGGAWRIEMQRGSGAVHHLKGCFEEMVYAERIVLAIDVSDNPASWHLLLDDFRGRPAEEGEHIVRTTILMDEDDGATRLTLRQRFATERERDGYLYLGIRNAWGQSLDKLEELLVHPS